MYEEVIDHTGSKAMRFDAPPGGHWYKHNSNNSNGGGALNDQRAAAMTHELPRLHFKTQMVMWLVESDPATVHHPNGARGGEYSEKVTGLTRSKEPNREAYQAEIPITDTGLLHKKYSLKPMWITNATIKNANESKHAKHTREGGQANALLVPSSPFIKDRVANGRLFVTVRKLIDANPDEFTEGVALKLAYGSMTECTDKSLLLTEQVHACTPPFPPAVEGGNEIVYDTHFSFRVHEKDLEKQYLTVTSHPNRGKKKEEKDDRSFNQDQPHNHVWHFKMSDVVKHGTKGVTYGKDNKHEPAAAYCGKETAEFLKCTRTTPAGILEIRMVVRYVDPEADKEQEEQARLQRISGTGKPVKRASIAESGQAAVANESGSGNRGARTATEASTKKKAKVKRKLAVKRDFQRLNHNFQFSTDKPLHEEAFDKLLVPPGSYTAAAIKFVAEKLPPCTTDHLQLFTAISLVVPYGLGWLFGSTVNGWHAPILWAIVAALSGVAYCWSLSMLDVAHWLAHLTDADDVQKLVNKHAVIKLQPSLATESEAKPATDGKAAVDSVDAVKMVHPVVELELKTMQHSLPPWAYYPSVEKTDWLNELILAFWPHVTDFAEKQVQTALAEVSKELPSWASALGKLELKHSFFGPKFPPIIEGVRSYTRARQGAQIIIDLFVTFANHTSINVGMGGTECLKCGNVTCYCELSEEEEKQRAGNTPLLDFIGDQLSVRVKNVSFAGCLRVVMAPLVNAFPCVGAIKVSFIDIPDFHYDVDVCGLPVTALPGLESVINVQIKNVIREQLVYPNEISLDMGVDFAKANLSKSGQRKWGTGLLIVEVVSADGLRNSDFFGSSDPYCEVVVAETNVAFETRHIDNNLCPEWKERFAFIVTDEKATVVLTVRDYDDVRAMTQAMNKTIKTIPGAGKMHRLPGAGFDVDSHLGTASIDDLVNQDADTVYQRRLTLLYKSKPSGSILTRIEWKPFLTQEEVNEKKAEAPRRGSVPSPPTIEVKRRMAGAVFCHVYQCLTLDEQPKDIILRVGGRSCSAVSDCGVELSGLQPIVQATMQVAVDDQATTITLEVVGSGTYKTSLKDLSENQNQFSGSVKLTRSKNAQVELQIGYKAVGDSVPKEKDEVGTQFAKGVLRVCVEKAVGLKNVERFSKSDPFCVIQLHGEVPAIETKTKYINNDLNPIWGQHFEFPIEDMTGAIDFKVHDYENIGHGKMLGEAQIWLTQLPADVMVACELPLRLSGKSEGTLHVQVEWKPFIADAGQAQRQDRWLARAFHRRVIANAEVIDKTGDLNEKRRQELQLVVDKKLMDEKYRHHHMLAKWISNYDWSRGMFQMVIEEWINEMDGKHKKPKCASLLVVTRSSPDTTPLTHPGCPSPEADESIRDEMIVKVVKASDHKKTILEETCSFFLSPALPEATNDHATDVRTTEDVSPREARQDDVLVGEALEEFKKRMQQPEPKEGIAAWLKGNATLLHTIIAKAKATSTEEGVQGPCKESSCTCNAVSNGLCYKHGSLWPDITIEARKAEPSHFYSRGGKAPKIGPVHIARKGHAEHDKEVVASHTLNLESVDKDNSKPALYNDGKRRSGTAVDGVCELMLKSSKDKQALAEEFANAALKLYVQANTLSDTIGVVPWATFKEARVLQSTTAVEFEANDAVPDVSRVTNASPSASEGSEPAMRVTYMKPTVLDVGTLEVTVLEASELTPVNTSGTSDPYVSVRLGGKKHKTATIFGNMNPKWTQKNRFSFNVLDVESDVLEIVVKHDAGMMRKKKRLGKSDIRIIDLASTIEPNKEEEYQVPLNTGGQGHGAVKLVLKYVCGGVLVCLCMCRESEREREGESGGCFGAMVREVGWMDVDGTRASPCCTRSTHVLTPLVLPPPMCRYTEAALPEDFIARHKGKKLKDERESVSSFTSLEQHYHGGSPLSYGGALSPGPNYGIDEPTTTPSTGRSLSRMGGGGGGSARNTPERTGTTTKL
jgi:hypothetical protein